MSYNSKYTGQEVEQLLDQVAEGGAEDFWDCVTQTFIEPIN